MFDFRLKVFDTVAKRLNFTKAADELNITQPAVSKHIKEIEQQMNLRLFERNGTRIKLTPAGKILLKHTEKIFAVYRELEFDINQVHQKDKGILRLGASTTIAQYVLPVLLADFHKRYKDIKVSLTIQNTEAIETLLASQTIDLGMIEGKTKNKLFRYSAFIKDDIVLAARRNHPLASRAPIKIEALTGLPLLLREPGSGTLETISFALKPFGIKLSDLHPAMQLGNTESIKSYLLHSDAVAFLSRNAIGRELQNKSLVILPVTKLNIVRDFFFIQPQGDAATVVGFFMNYVKRYNFK